MAIRLWETFTFYNHYSRTGLSSLLFEFSKDTVCILNGAHGMGKIIFFSVVLSLISLLAYAYTLFNSIKLLMYIWTYRVQQGVKSV